MKFRLGLVVGKFSPLHRGHVYLVEQARARCEQLLILSYSKPELPGCERELRQRWLTRAFPFAQCIALDDAWLQAQPAARALRLSVPDNTAPDAQQREFLGSLCEHVLSLAVDALFTSEDYGEPGAAAFAQRFRRDVTHIMVDRARLVVPISATQIRADVHTHREAMPAHVYASYVQRIAIVGGESSGKSTLALALAERFATEAAPEYGRELWERQRGALLYEDLLHIAEQQIAREESACERARRYVFCDTTPYVTLFYCRDLFGRAEPELERLASRGYALHVLCAPDFTFVQDGTRREASFRETQHAHYRERLSRSGEPWMLVTGDLQTRVQAVADRLAQLNRP